MVAAIRVVAEQTTGDTGVVETALGNMINELRNGTSGADVVLDLDGYYPDMSEYDDNAAFAEKQIAHCMSKLRRIMLITE
jgi:hypothetical protein